MALVVIDPKGERELLMRTAAAASRAQRPFALISTAFPQHSVSVNPLASARTPGEVAMRIQALMPESKEPFYQQFSLALIEHLAAAQLALGIPWTLEGLYKVSVIREHMEALLQQYLIHLGCFIPGNLDKIIGRYAALGKQDLIADALIEDKRWPGEHYRKITGTLVPTFRGVVGGAIGALLSPRVPDVTWERIVENNMVVYVALASMLLGEDANRIGRVLLQDLIGFLGQRYAYGDSTQAKPLTIIVDEFGNVAYPGFIDAINKGGGANARFILAVQSFADIEAVMGIAHARRVLDNLNTKICFRLADDRTAQEVAEGFGFCEVQRTDTSTGLSYGGARGLSGSSQRRYSSQEKPLVRPVWFTALPRGHAFARIQGEMWKIEVPLLPPVPQECVQSLALTVLWEGLAPEKCED